MKYIVYFMVDDSIAVVDPDDFLCPNFPANPLSLSNHDWISINQTMYKGICLYKGKSYDDTILIQPCKTARLIVNEDQVDTAISFIERVLFEKKLKIESLLKIIEINAFQQKRQKFVPLKNIQTESESEISQDIREIERTSSSNNKENFNNTPLPPFDKTPSITSTSLPTTPHRMLNVPDAETPTSSIFPKPSQFHNLSIEAQALNYLREKQIKWGSVEGLYHLMLINLRETAKLRNELQNYGKHSKPDDDILDDRFPLKTLAQYEETLTLLQNDRQFRKNLKSRLSRCVENKLTSTVRRMIDFLMTRDLQVLFNKDGKRDPRNKEKNPKRKFQLMDIIKSVAGSFGDEEIEKAVGSFLANASKKIESAKKTAARVKRVRPAPSSSESDNSKQMRYSDSDSD